MKKQKKIWFKAKHYGWGWYPSSWEGWLIMLAWIALFTLAVIKMDHEWLKNFVFIFIITAILIWICWKTGEKPKWRWGKEEA
jgi:uncharacterized membrane protein YhaH (DUF805 family)